MKKWITLVSAVLGFSFAIALAVAEDTTGTTQPSDPGMSSSTTRNPSPKTATSCTDDKGITYKKGDKGFKSCLNTLEKREHGAGGQAGTTPSPTGEPSP